VTRKSASIGLLDDNSTYFDSISLPSHHNGCSWQSISGFVDYDDDDNDSFSLYEYSVAAPSFRAPVERVGPPNSTDFIARRNISKYQFEAITAVTQDEEKEQPLDMVSMDNSSFNDSGSYEQTLDDSDILGSICQEMEMCRRDLNIDDRGKKDKMLASGSKVEYSVQSSRKISSGKNRLEKSKGKRKPSLFSCLIRCFYKLKHRKSFLKKHGMKVKLASSVFLDARRASF